MKIPTLKLNVIIRRQLIASLIKQGKKFKIEKMLNTFKWNTFLKTKRYNRNFIEKSLANTIKICLPTFVLKTKRKGKSGLTVIPKYLPLSNSIRLVWRWLSYFILRKHFHEPLLTRFGYGMDDIFKKNIAEILKKKNDLDNQAFDNRSFRHFRWWKGI